MLSQRTFWPAVLVRIRVLRDGLLLPSIRPSVPSVDPFIYSAAASTVISVLAWIVLLQLQYAHLEEEEKVMTAVVSTTSRRECCWRRGAVEWLCRSLPQAAFIPVSFLSTEKRASRSPGWVSEIDEDEPIAPASFAQLDRLTRWTAAAAAAVAMPDYCDSDPIRSVRGPSGVRLACGDCFPLIFHSTTDSKADELCICMESFEWSAQWRGITSNQII